MRCLSPLLWSVTLRHSAPKHWTNCRRLVLRARECVSPAGAAPIHYLVIRPDLNPGPSAWEANVLINLPPSQQVAGWLSIWKCQYIRELFINNFDLTKSYPFCELNNFVPNSVRILILRDLNVRSHHHHTIMWRISISLTYSGQIQIPYME